MATMTLGDKVLAIIQSNEAIQDSCQSRPPRKISRLEDLSREWGLFYGIAVGLILAEEPFQEHSRVADHAFEAAKSAFDEWVNSGADEIRWIESGGWDGIDGMPIGETEETA